MRVNRYGRQILLFLLAILVPAAALIGLAGRIFYQERELALRRAAGQRQSALDQLRRELAARLEAIKLQEVNRMIRSRGSADIPVPENPAVIFAATLDGERPVLPWEALSGETAAAGPDYARHREAGERQEFARKDFGAAAETFRLALAAAHTPRENAEARLFLARTLVKGGNTAEAAAQYRTLLTAAPETRDEQGVGFRFYAAERLIELRRESGPVRTLLAGALESDQRLTLPELYMVRTLLGSLPEAERQPLLVIVSSRVAQLEQAVSLARDFPRVRAQIETGAPNTTVWASFGEEPWLVTLVPQSAPLPSLVVVVSSARAAPPGVTLLSRASQGDLLGESFPGLRAVWTDDRFVESVPRGTPTALYIAGLALVLGITGLGGYLVLRDVNRDVRTSEVRSQFVASVSHELKTPLTAIRMFAETLALGRSRNEQARSEYLETIVNESERLARLVDNVLDFSKIEHGKKIYRLEPTQLADVAGSAVRAMQYPLSQQGFKLNLSIQEEMPLLRADADAIQQAILNLLTNAMKYSGSSREIDLRLACRNGDALIQVQDRGLGIDPDEQKHVFEKFYRARSHDRHLIAGTGLGLTLVAHIAEAHGGRVELESAPGAGSTFSILLPFERHS